MAASSADSAELRRACATAIGGGGSKGDIVLAIRVAKGRGILEKLGRMAKPRVLALSSTLSSFLPSSMASLSRGSVLFLYSWGLLDVIFLDLLFLSIEVCNCSVGISLFLNFWKFAAKDASFLLFFFSFDRLL